MNPKVKKVILIFFIVFCLGATGYGGYLIYLNLDTTPVSVEKTTNPVPEDPGVLRVQIASLPESDFQLYEESGALILIHKGKETRFDWKGIFTAEKVQMNFADYNGDGQNELAVVITTKNEGGQESNELHILSLLENGAEINYRDTVIATNSFRWNREGEITAVQDESKRRIGVTIGAGTDYFRAPVTENGSYYIFQELTYDNGKFQLTPGTAEIQAEVPVTAVFADYKETCNPGVMRAKLVYRESQYLYTDLSFERDGDWAIMPPLEQNPSPFIVQSHNTDPRVSTGLIVSRLDMKLEAGDMARRDFHLSASDEIYLTDIVVTESYITLILPHTMSFNEALLQTNPPTVWLGGADGFYIQAHTEVSKVEETYYMRTYFSEKIGRNDFTELTYHFGA